MYTYVQVWVIVVVVVVSNKAPANRSIWLFGVGWIRFDAIILYDGDKERV
jgi:hypothetical protein